MKLNQIVSPLLIVLLVLSCKAYGSISITSHTSSSEWWLAYAVSDASTTALELKDSGSYSSWSFLQATNWGYFVFTTNGQAVTFPVSLRLTSATGQITLVNVFTSADAGQTVDTQTSFPGSSGTSTQAPTTAPTQTPTEKPTTAPTQAPTTAPTQAPTQKPTTAPTTAPTQAPTQKPTTAPTTAPTQAPTQKPTTAPTSAPTQHPTSAPTTAPTQAPTQKPTTAPTTAPTQAPTQKPTAPPSNPSTSTGNPFAGTEYYINPHYTIEVDSSIALNPSMSAQLAKVKAFASAFWVDRMAVIDNVTTILTQARMQATSSGSTVMAAIVVYDLPDRDCAAAASNGEISCADATCADGINTYKTQYIDPLVAVLKEFPDLEIVAIVEPDSLPNLATNLATPKCTQAQTAYITGVSYAIEQLSTMSNVHIYVDAAHGGWLGWDTGRAAAVAVFSQVLTLAGGASKIRGFATNVANYQPLGFMTSTDDPCALASQYNFAINEVKYVSLLDASLTAAGITGMHYIIDTGRNGVPNARTSCSNWCNIKNAGLGVPPTSDTTSSGLTNIDAYFWVKPPGESDGTSDSSAARYDYHCGSVDSMIPAPEAGNWFSNSFVTLATNANPAL